MKWMPQHSCEVYKIITGRAARSFQHNEKKMLRIALKKQEKMGIPETDERSVQSILAS